MTGSLVMYGMYYIVMIGFYSKIGWRDLNSYRWAYMFTFTSATLLFVIGAVLNVHKWISFLLRVLTSIKAEKVLADL